MQITIDMKFTEEQLEYLKNLLQPIIGDAVDFLMMYGLGLKFKPEQIEHILQDILDLHSHFELDIFSEEQQLFLKDLVFNKVQMAYWTLSEIAAGREIGMRHIDMAVDGVKAVWDKLFK